MLVFCKNCKRVTNTTSNLMCDICNSPNISISQDMTNQTMKRHISHTCIVIDDKIPMKRAACVLIVNTEGLILSVSRKDDPTAFGIPGGKVDDSDHSIYMAAIRECLEETGLYVQAKDKDQEPFYSDIDGYATYTYLCVISEYKDPLPVTEKGVVGWKTKEDLINGPFGDYNIKLFEHFKI